MPRLDRSRDKSRHRHKHRQRQRRKHAHMRMHMQQFRLLIIVDFPFAAITDLSNLAGCLVLFPAATKTEIAVPSVVRDSSGAMVG